MEQFGVFIQLQCGLNIKFEIPAIGYNEKGCRNIWKVNHLFVPHLSTISSVSVPIIISMYRPSASSKVYNRFLLNLRPQLCIIHFRHSTFTIAFAGTKLSPMLFPRLHPLVHTPFTNVVSTIASVGISTIHHAFSTIASVDVNTIMFPCLPPLM